MIVDIHLLILFYFRSYDRLLKPTNMKTNKDDDGNDSDDFM